MPAHTHSKSAVLNNIRRLNGMQEVAGGSHHANLNAGKSLVCNANQCSALLIKGFHKLTSNHTVKQVVPLTRQRVRATKTQVYLSWSQCFSEFDRTLAMESVQSKNKTNKKSRKLNSYRVQLWCCRGNNYTLLGGSCFQPRYTQEIIGLLSLVFSTPIL